MGGRAEIPEDFDEQIRYLKKPFITGGIPQEDEP